MLHYINVTKILVQNFTKYYILIRCSESTYDSEGKYSDKIRNDLSKFQKLH